MRSSAVVLTAATVCWTGSVTACWTNSRLSRRQKHVTWPEQESLTTLLQCCVNSTGFRYSSESPSS